ncbi:hypothetical protein PLICRDRAFT_98827 [Plicaturopsis crispa FD-325 SS-3]|nr:hypothetical protein PLICRDRAFT_98827 [Plicaturopsis crispa FD-325 SS-3]
MSVHGDLSVTAPDQASITKGPEVHSEEADFGGELGLPEAPELTEAQEKKLWRKVDLRLMPILSLMYLMSFLDRGNAKLQGLTTQLDLTGNKYNIALVSIYCCKFRPSRWLPGITITWGVIMTLMGLVKDYPQLVGVRLCLGVAEAGLFPGIVYYLTLWYPRHQLQYRIGMFVGSASLSGAFSGLLAFGISFMSGTRGLLGWSWIFIIEGMATVVVGLLAVLVLVDFPSTAAFLTPEERAFVVKKLSKHCGAANQKYDNSTVGEEEGFAMRHVWAAFVDWQVWVHLCIYISIIGPLYGITLFLPFGFNTAISQLLTVPPYVFASILLLFFAHYSDKWRLRSLFVMVGLVLSLIGWSINISDASIGAKYVGTFFCVAGTYGAFPAVIAWLGNNLAGQYKRAVGMALHIGIGNFSGAISSNVYRTQDAPRYIIGHGIELMFIGIGFVSVPIAVVAYMRINAKRDAVERLALESGERQKYTVQELRDMGDRAPDFRYTL